MSTNNKPKKIKQELQHPEVIEDFKPEVEEKLVTEEQIVAQEQSIDNIPVEEWEDEIVEEASAPEVTPTEVEKEEVKENVFNFPFQKDYFFGTPNTDKETVIDTLPEIPPQGEPDMTPIINKPAEPKRKTLQQMTACEINIYHKTGILPLL